MSRAGNPLFESRRLNQNDHPLLAANFRAAEQRVPMAHGRTVGILPKPPKPWKGERISLWTVPVRTPSLRSRAGRIPIQVPVVVPKIFQLRQFRMAVCQPDVYRAGKGLSRIEILGRTGGIDTAMPGNRETLHPIGAASAIV